MDFFYTRTPRDEAIDNEERASGIDEAREARVKCVELLNSFAVEIDTALSNPCATIGQVASAFYGVSFALGLSAIGNTTMSEVANRFGVTRASISKRAVQFGKVHDLAPSWHQKSEKSRANYRAAREDVVRKIATSNDADHFQINSARACLEA